MRWLRLEGTRLTASLPLGARLWLNVVCASVDARGVPWASPGKGSLFSESAAKGRLARAPREARFASRILTEWRAVCRMAGTAWASATVVVGSEEKFEEGPFVLPTCLLFLPHPSMLRSDLDCPTR